MTITRDRQERTGRFFTPKIWAELSQQYLAKVLGENWQDEYFIWDCAAGTGNLLAGLTNKYNIYASTLDQQDVDVMHDRIKNGANLLEDHVFQFDFLNDDFAKLPPSLKSIIDDPEQRKKLVIYINPPYAEVSSKGVKAKAGVNISNTHKRYTDILGTAGRELFTQFLTCIYFEIKGCIIAEFSTLKLLQGTAFAKLRSSLQPKLERCFIVPADTFDNVKGQFPIGFKIWNSQINHKFETIEADIYLRNGTSQGKKLIRCYDDFKTINEWLRATRNRLDEKRLGFIACLGNDFQTVNLVHIMNDKTQMRNPRGSWVTSKNLLEVSIYFAVRKCIKATWLNDRDQFLAPNNKWKKDFEFQNDCLTYTLFSNNIQSQYGTNHWIPFIEVEVNARSRFKSHFMTDFIAGKFKPKKTNGLHDGKPPKPNGQLHFSEAAQAVFEAGKILWTYYHSQPNPNVDASLYDIRAYFQGRNAKGRMNSRSQDEYYTNLIANLRTVLKILSKKIEPKVYEYRFLLS